MFCGTDRAGEYTVESNLSVKELLCGGGETRRQPDAAERRIVDLDDVSDDGSTSAISLDAEQPAADGGGTPRATPHATPRATPLSSGDVHERVGPAWASPAFAESRSRRAHRARADLDGEWALSGYPLTDGSFRIVANHDDEVLEVHVVDPVVVRVAALEGLLLRQPLPAPASHVEEGQRARRHAKREPAAVERVRRDVEIAGLWRVAHVESQRMVTAAPGASAGRRPCTELAPEAPLPPLVHGAARRAAHGPDCTRPHGLEWVGPSRAVRPMAASIRFTPHGIARGSGAELLAHTAHPGEIPVGELRQDMRVERVQFGKVRRRGDHVYARHEEVSPHACGASVSQER